MLYNSTATCDISTEGEKERAEKTGSGKSR
jgi:hypothetical protein